MVTEDYVSFETAKLLKEKGFDEPCHTAYSLAGKTHKVEQRSISDWGKINQAKRPTLQMAMKWLREVHKIYIQVVPLVPEYYEKDDSNYYGTGYGGRCDGLRKCERGRFKGRC